MSLLGIYRHHQQPQRAEPVQPTIVPATALTPATTKETAAKAGYLDDVSILSQSDQDFLDLCIMSATRAANRMTGFEHADRQVTILWDHRPGNEDAVGGLHPIEGPYIPWLEIPVWPVKEVTGAEFRYLDGTTASLNIRDTDTEGKPPRVQLDVYVVSLPHGLASLAVDLNVGPRDTDDVEQYELAVALAAAYLFEHRNCAGTKALEDSGAASMLKGYAVEYML